MTWWPWWFAATLLVAGGCVLVRRFKEPSVTA
jgi:hypothetical protein